VTRRRPSQTGRAASGGDSNDGRTVVPLASLSPAQQQIVLALIEARRRSKKVAG
jgi:hypothetical protein